jgi:hypothetical protein
MRPKKYNLTPKVTIGQPEEKIKDFADKEEADSVDLIQFAIAAGNVYFEAMLRKPTELPRQDSCSWRRQQVK